MSMASPARSPSATCDGQDCIAVMACTKATLRQLITVNTLPPLRARSVVSVVRVGCVLPRGGAHHANAGESIALAHGRESAKAMAVRRWMKMMARLMQDSVKYDRETG